MPKPPPPPSSSRGLLIAVAILMIGLFLGLAKWLSVWGAFQADPGETERAEFRQKTLAALQTEDKTRLESFAWVDRASGSVQIPIDLAMKVVLPELRASKPREAYPFVPPQTSPPGASSSGSAGILPALACIPAGENDNPGARTVRQDAGQSGQDARAPVSKSRK